MSQLPFSPDDLGQPPLSGTAYLELLDSDFARKTTESPLVYEKIIDGSLSLEHIKVWVKDLYLYWDTLYFSTGGIFIKTNETKTREGMLRKLVEVEGRVIVNDVNAEWTNPAYEEMWLTLAEGVGLKRNEVTSWQTFTRSFFSVSTLCMYSRSWEWSWLDGIANLYAADLFYVEYLAKIEQSLRSNYKLSEESLAVFRAVVADAKENIPFEQETLAYWACSTERQLTSARAFRERIDIEYQALQSVNDVISGADAPFQIPVGAVIPPLLDRT
jgi:pyrroloquinoline quinone (PQQ) biosynthesis protein C